MKTSKALSASAPPRVFLYVRYSSKEQAKGDSARRQRELGNQRARERGIKIDGILRITDRGVSAFRGKNRTHGALGGFLKSLEAGTIPHGSELWVENLDRLSRDYLTEALTLFLQIVKKGLTIVTLDDKNEYNERTLNQSMGHWMQSLVHMSTAHTQSLIKSSRGKENWKEKRKNIKEVKLTSLAPAWLKLSPDRRHFELVEDRVAVVQWLFKQRANGVGVFRLARQLDDRKEPVWGRGKRAGERWHKSYVTKILANRSVLGEFQPHRMEGEGDERKRVAEGAPVPGYFPVIVSEDLFHRVQQLKTEDTRRPGQIGARVSSLFTWIAKCGRTGKAANFVNKSKYQYLKTDGVLDDGRRMVGWSYEDFELRFLTAVGRLDLTKIFDAQESNETTQMERLLAAANARVRETGIVLKRLLKVLESSTEKAPETVLERIRELEAQRAGQHQEVEMATTALKKARDAAADAAKFSSDFKRLMAERHKPDTRLALRQEIRSIVSRIDVFFDVAETPAERQKRESFAAAVSKMPKGIKVIGGMPSSKPPARHMVVTFANGVQRTIAQSHDGKVLVYESDTPPVAFALVEIPRRTNSFKALDDTDKDS